MRSLLNAFSARFLGHLKDYSSYNLTRLDGKQVVQGGLWKNIQFQGQTVLGTEGGERTLFSGIVVINGDLIAKNCEFSTLDVRGSYQVHNCAIQTGLFYGQGKIVSSQADQLHLQAPGGNLLIAQSTIKGDLYFRSMGVPKGKLTLDGTTVSGCVFTDPGKLKTVKVINNSSPVTIKEEPQNGKDAS